MARDPIPAYVFIVASRLVIGLTLSSGVELDLVELPECESGNWFERLLDVASSGCGLDSAGVFWAAALGVVPGAHWTVNTLVGAVTNAMLVWAFLAWLRGQ